MAGLVLLTMTCVDGSRVLEQRNCISGVSRMMTVGCFRNIECLLMRIASHLDSINDAEVGANWALFNASSETRDWDGYSSGGGFAFHFETPAYQKEALSTFFDKHNPRWPYFTDGRWQNGTGRYSK